MKNQFGLIPEKFKAKYHLRGMHKVITDINKALPPTITLVDGFVAMEGRGPARGNPLTMNTILAGVDPVAVDATASRVMLFDPWRIPHIRMAYEEGLGEIDKIKIMGDDIESVKKNFKPA